MESAGERPDSNGFQREKERWELDALMINQFLKEFCYNWKQINTILTEKRNGIERVCLFKWKKTIPCLCGGNYLLKKR